MKQKIKQSLIAIVGVLLSTSAFAHDFEVDGIYFNHIDKGAKTVEVTYYMNDQFSYRDRYSGDITIPSSVLYNDTTYFVTQIGDDAFHNCYKVTSVKISQSIIIIGDYAFADCTSLSSVTIPNSVTTIRENAFSNCPKLESIIIPNSVSKIEESTFWYCTSLTSIIIPNSITSIGKRAFGYCENLASINIPNSVTTIGEYAFVGCEKLATVDIQDLSTWCKINFGDRTANPLYYAKDLNLNGSKLEALVIPPDVPEIKSNVFYGYSSLTSIIANSVTTIGDNAFSNCNNLVSVHIGPSTIQIGKDAFNNCYKLTDVNTSDLSTWCKINFGNSTANPLYYAKDLNLNGCKIKELVIPDGITEVKDYAFQTCSSITSVIISNSVSTIGKCAFNGCNNISSLTIGSGILSIEADAFSVKPIKTFFLTNTPPSGFSHIEGLINYVGNNRFSSLSNVTIYPYLSSMFNVNGVKYVPVTPSEQTCDAIDCVYDTTAINISIDNTVSFKGVSMTVKNINPYICYGNNYIKECKINSNSTIGEYAFYYCNNLESLTLSVTKIKTSAFEGCSEIKEITLENGLESIGDSAFYGCRNLTEIVIPNTVTSIGDYTFKDCNSLSNILIEDRDSVLTLGSNGSTPIFSDCPLDSVYIGGNISYKTTNSYGYSPFYNNKTLRVVTLTDKETEISENEFYGCSNLKSVTIGDGMESIGNWAFSGCSNLETFEFGSSMKTIGEEAFSDCAALTRINSKAMTPPVCGPQALDDINKWTCKLYVPNDVISAYQAADQWKEFFFISEDTGVEDIIIDGINIEIEINNGEININGADNPHVEIYNLNGQCIYSGKETIISGIAHGIYIVKINGISYKVKI